MPATKSRALSLSVRLCRSTEFAGEIATIGDAVLDPEGIGGAEIGVNQSPLPDSREQVNVSGYSASPI